MSTDRDATLLEFPCAFPIKAVGRADIGFEALVVAGPDYDAATPEWLRSRLAAFLEDDIELTLRPVEAIPREASGKLRVAKNLMDGAG